jgi:hypothetical protein
MVDKVKGSVGLYALSQCDVILKFVWVVKDILSKQRHCDSNVLLIVKHVKQDYIASDLTV